MSSDESEQCSGKRTLAQSQRLLQRMFRTGPVVPRHALDGLSRQMFGTGLDQQCECEVRPAAATHRVVV
jgi:hypothetical protein